MSRSSTPVSWQLAAPLSSGWARLLVLALGMIGVGNLIFPPDLRASLPVDYLNASLAICVGALMLAMSRVGRNLARPLVLGLFALSVIPGFVTTQMNPYGLSKALGFLIAFILMVAPSAFSSAASGALAILKALTAAAGASSILLLLTGTDFVMGRATLFGLNPIGVARLTGLYIVLAVATVLLGFPRKLGQRLVLLALTPLAVLATISTGSRGPLLASGIAILTTVLVVMMRRGIRPGFVFLVAACSGATAILVLSSGAAGLDRVTQGSDSGRIDLFGSTLHVFTTHPLGIGWGNLAAYLPEYTTIDGYTLYPHNFFLELAVEGGLFALLGGACLLFVVFRRLVRSARVGSSVVAPMVLAFLVYGVVNSLLSSDIVGNRMMWLGVGLGLAQFGTSWRLQVDAFPKELSG